MRRHDVVQNDEWKRLLEYLYMEVHVSEIHAQFREKFLSLQFEFPSISDSHLWCIATVKHSTEQPRNY